MKKIHTYIMSIIIVFSFKTMANPIAILYISELVPDSTHFSIEIKTYDIDSLNGWYITSKTDTAYLKDGLLTNGNFILITQDSLKSHLSLDSLSDEITLWSPDGVMDRIYYGNVSNSFISTPKHGQSICLNEYYDFFQHYYYYLDNTPTLGYINDTSGAVGYMDGYIVDSLGHPISGIEMIYDYKEIIMDSLRYFTATTDSNGYFIFKNISRRTSLYLKTDLGFGDFLKTEQIYPDDTVSVRIVYSITVDHILPERTILANLYLEQNFPNPFNNSTTFYYTLEKRDYIEISIYDLRGRLVDILYSGYKNPGTYNMVWNAGNISSGIYMIQLSSPNFSLTRKCLYLK